jgi:non-specific serine/threonine protein kinase
MRRPLLTAALLRSANLSTTADPRVVERGRHHAWYSQIDYEELTATAARLFVRGRGHNDGRVRFELIDGGRLSCDCNCLQFTGETPCEHIIGAAIALEKHLQYTPINNWETRIQAALRSDTAAKKKTAAQILVFSLYKPYRGWTLAPFGLPRGRSIPMDCDALDAKQVQAAANSSGLAVRNYRLKQLNPSLFPDATEAMLLAARFSLAGSQNSYYNNESSTETLDAALRLLENAPVFMGTEQEPLKKIIQIRPEGGSLSLNISQLPDGGLQIMPHLAIGEAKPKPRKTFEVILPEPLWLLVGDELASFGNVPKTLTGFLGADPIDVPVGDLEYFRTEYLVPMAEHLLLTGEAIFGEIISDAELTPRLYLTEQNKELHAELRFGYGPSEAPARADYPESSLTPNPKTEKLDKVVRQPIKERTAHDLLPSLGLKRIGDHGHYTLRARLNVVDFLLHYVPKLAEAGFEVFGEDSLKNVRVNRSTPSISFAVKSGIDWFDLDAVIQFGETTASLKDVRQAIKKREQFVKLADGSIGMIPPEWIERYKHLFALADEGDKKGESLRLSPLHALLLEQAIADSDGSAKLDAEFSRKLIGLREFDKTPDTPIPEGFLGELRPYQKAGYDWLHFLKNNQFGGCLADDMGTGKTLATLALLHSVSGDRATIFSLQLGA